ncbi:MAG: DUF1501 domain-containing protein [Woeseiaceae bacterium]
MITRRTFVHAASLGLATAGLPRLSLGGQSGKANLVLVILRGAADGVAIAAPYGDGSYQSLRGELALPSPGQTDGLLKLDGLFGLNPAMPELYRAWSEKQATIIHAVASPYRSRSHFDGQDVLENGSSAATTQRSGWMNRVLGPSGQSAASSAIAISPHIPLILRGDNPAANWAPSSMAETSDATLARVQDMYAADEFLSTRLTQALLANEIAASGEAMDGRPARASSAQYFRQLMQAAANFLTTEDGPTMAVVEAGGWDTHANQGTTRGTLANRLSMLDAGLADLKNGLGASWDDTAVLVVTEFGRTLRVNGTRGTDHGTASAAVLVGGAVRGGRVIADWPGLRSSDLYEDRDLMPTTDLRSVFKAALRDHAGLSEAYLETTVFPDSRDARPLEGLFRSQAPI